MKERGRKRTAGKGVLMGVGIAAAVIASVFILAFLGFYAVMSIATANNYDSIESSDDGFQYLVRYHNRNKLRAAVSEYSYNPYDDSNEITIPDMYGDYPVHALGGYIGKGGPCPFFVSAKRLHGYSYYIVDPEDAFELGVDPDKLEYFDLVMNIGPNIREVIAKRVGFASGSSGYIVRLYINCDPDNPKFYSENGRLYTKKGELVDGLIYWDEDYR